MSDQNSQISLLEQDQLDELVVFTWREKRFMNFYLGEAGFNGAEAARRSGYSPKTARNIACEILAKPYIAREIKRRLELMELTTDEIIGRLSKMALGEIPTKTVCKGDETTEIFDERQALENIGRARGIFIDKHQIQAIQGLLIEDG